jgi:hypothetical protein
MLRKLCQPRYSTTVGLVIAMAACALAIPASATQPAATNLTAAQAPNRCGPGYGQVDSENLNALGPNFGTVYLYYNSSNGKNCVFTEKLVARGTATYTTATLCRLSDGACAPPDRGNYKYYAGPIYLYARGTCVKWGGRVTNTDGRYDEFTSGWEHCG